MSKLTFSEYLEDVIDAHIGLMSVDEIAQAKKAYKVFITVEKKKRVAKHPDAKMKLAELRSKVERLLKCAYITIERNQDKDLTMINSFIAKAEENLAGKHTKADLLDLITSNSEANRDMNNQLK